MPPRDAEPSLTEAEFTLTALKQGVRVDGREPAQMRKVEFEFGLELGWVQVRLGHTRVVAQVSAEIVEPYADRPYEGFLLVHAEISPMASPAFEAGRASEEEIIFDRLLEKALRRSDAVDREALCIVAGQKVWSVRVDVHLLDHAGNALDCACLAAVTALRHFRKPDVTVVGDEVTVHPVEERVPVPLAIHHTPICVTYVFFNDAPAPLIDPTSLETTLSSSTLVLTLNAQRELCVLDKAGGAPLKPEELLTVLRAAVSKVRELSERITRELEKDAKTRVLEVS